MSEIKIPDSSANPESISPSSASTLSTSLTIERQERLISDQESRIRRLESSDKPLKSYLRSMRRVSNISSFVIVLSPIILTLSILLAYILLNPSLQLSQAVITIFGFVGIVSLAEIVIVPIWVNNINNKLNKLIEKHYPNEDI